MVKIKMKSSKVIFQTLAALRQTGYSRVSLSELAYHTKLSKDQVLSSLRGTGHNVTIDQGEQYIQLSNDDAHFSKLPPLEKYKRLVGDR